MLTLLGSKRGLLQKQSVRPLYIFAGSLTKSHGRRGCQNLCMLIIQRALLKGNDEFPQEEFLFMLWHGERIFVYVHFFSFLRDSFLLKVYANVSLCCFFNILRSHIQELVHTHCTNCILMQQVNCTNWIRLKTALTLNLYCKYAIFVETLLEVNCLD